MELKHVRVKLITRMAGPEGVVQPGAVILVESGMARVLVQGKFAEYADPQPAPVVEEAVIGAPENAMAPRQRQRSKKGLSHVR